MSLTFRRWLSWQNRPPQIGPAADGPGCLGTFHAPTAIRKASVRITDPWDSPAELLHHLGADDDWYQAAIATTATQYNQAFRWAIGPRNGPHTGRGAAIWTRVIGGHHYLFWAWHDHLDVFHVPNNDQPPTRIHTYRKEN